MEEVLRDILSWYEKKSSPNECYAYSRCPICNATWWGDEIHNLQCWIPLLKHKLYLLEQYNSAVAQLGEHSTDNREVNSSNLFGATKLVVQLSWLEQSTYNRQIGGSSPPTTTKLKQEER